MSQTILMIHGMWGGSWYWEKYKTLFEKRGYRCITPVLRFHDMDPKTKPDDRLGTTSLLDYAEDIENEIRKLDGKPIIMGHSMGGLLAQILGSRGLARALVLLTPASPAGICAITPSVFLSFWGVQIRSFRMKPMRQTFDKAVYSMLDLVPSSEQRDVYEKFVYESGRAAFEIGYWFLDHFWKNASKVDASKVTCPILVIAGGKDRITPASVCAGSAGNGQPVVFVSEYGRLSFRFQLCVF